VVYGCRHLDSCVQLIRVFGHVYVKVFSIITQWFKWKITIVLMHRLFHSVFYLTLYIAEEEFYYLYLI